MERSSKLKLALGAASLFLFLVGVKRTFRSEDGNYIYDVESNDSGAEESSAGAGTRAAAGRV